MMKRIVVPMLAAALAGGAATVAMASPAQAAGDCPNGFVCMYVDANYQGGKIVQWMPEYIQPSQEIPWYDDNEVSSVINKTIRTIRLRDNDLNEASGETRDIPAGHWQPNLTSIGFNDRADSYSAE